MATLRNAAERILDATPYYLAGSTLDPACLLLVSPLIIVFGVSGAGVRLKGPVEIDDGPRGRPLTRAPLDGA